MTDFVAESGVQGAASERQIAARPYVRAWLYFICTLILAMVLVGGATRLTDSGLSITEWKPILGAIPPLSEADWQHAFSLYKQIPEYKVINRGMSLEEFKFIYWWEWAHRFLGRFIGIAFFIPLVFFWATDRIEKKLKPGLVVAFLVGGLQGFIGWYMVMSGLSERVDVSQYRLALHLGLAVAIFAYLYWMALGIGKRERQISDRAGWGALVLTILVFVQVILGAFVAGMDAGMGYNTWPLMDDALVPSGLFIMEPAWRNLFENAMTVQFNHRVLAYVIVIFAGIHIFRTLQVHREGPFAVSAGFAGLVVLVQVALGIWTLLAQVPIELALLHQGGAVILLAACLWHLHIAALEPAQATVTSPS
ncbi:MAG: COX15/CtaA family protein [Hyphomicrobiales bacterium]